MRKNGNSGGVEWKKKMEGTSMNNVLVKKAHEKTKNGKTLHAIDGIIRVPIRRC